MEMARLVAANSKDRHHRYGCVIVDNELAVLATGYNGFPRCVNDDVDARYERPAKYLYTTHAEQNAVADAARRGASLADSAVYVDDRFPCASCAGLLIQAGIRTVVARRPDLSHPRWGASWRAALEMLAEAGVEVRYLEGERVLRALPFAAAGPRSLGAFLRDPFPEGK
jgi:dCMP deaminase